MRRSLIALGGAALLFVVALHALDRVFPFPEDAFRRHGASPQVFAADGTRMRIGLNAGDERLVRARRFPPVLIGALIASEDRRFYRHAGVDPWAIARAAWMNVKRGHASEGASTITMQLARIVTPQPRTFAGKVVQAFRAWQIEQRHDKAFILDAYLNRVPFGGNLRGAVAASHAWFGKPVETLEAHEAALLVSMLPAPTRFRPDRYPAVAKRRRDRVLVRMGEATARPLGLRPTAFPDLGPHAWQQAGDGATGIDPALQAVVERIARSAEGVDGLAVVLVENESAAVRALVGAREATPRVLDATRRPRSAGSTLKPFVYAQAFDRGLATPDTKLLDLPWRTRDWAPSNFDRLWHGPVRAGHALSRSLNVPAVRLAAALPHGLFVETLRRAGLRHVRETAHDRGVDLAIGTDDATPLELVGAYRALASGGTFVRPWVSASSQGTEGVRLCSVGAAALVTQALADPLRARPPGAPTEGLAWKTGTSSNRRDAWSVGYTRRYTAVVWRGRLDGKPDPSLVGSEAATPLLFRVLLAADPRPTAFPAPRNVISVEVCAETGLARGRACGRGLTSLRPQGSAPLRRCDVHHRIVVDPESGCRVCARCRKGRPVGYADLAIRTPQLAAWRHRVGLPSDVVPPHDPTCSDPIEEEALYPRIAMPVDGTVLEADGEGAEAVVRVLASAPDETLEILLDGRPVGSLRSGAQGAFRLTPGDHVLLAVSSRGHTARARVRVE